MADDDKPGLPAGGIKEPPQPDDPATTAEGPGIAPGTGGRAATRDALEWRRQPTSPYEGVAMEEKPGCGMSAPLNPADLAMPADRLARWERLHTAMMQFARAMVAFIQAGLDAAGARLESLPTTLSGTP